MSYEIAVHPATMLVIDYRDEAQAEQTVVAVACSYVPVLNAQQHGRRIGIEIVYDPGNPHPAQPYYCPAERLERILLPPARLQRVRLYAP